MNSTLACRFAILLLCASLAAVEIPAAAQIGQIGISKGQAVGIVVGIVAIGAAIGVGVYFLVRKDPSITGCAVSNQRGLELQNEGDQRTYMLIGEAAKIKGGDRIRVRGQKKKTAGSGNQDFLVKELTRDYGPCKNQPATHP